MILTATGTTDINTDPDCYRAMDPDVILSSSLGLDNTGYSEPDRKTKITKIKLNLKHNILKLLAVLKTAI